MTWTYVLYVYLILPLLAIAYVLLGGYIVYRLMTSTVALTWRLGAALVVLVVLVAIPIGDEVVGRAWFGRLCEKEAVTKVNRVVRLDAKDLKATGTPKWEVLPTYDGYRIAGRYTVKLSDEQLARWPRITKARTVIIDEHDQSLVAESVEPRYWGGWLVEWLPGHRGAATCIQVEGSIPLEQRVFKK